MDTAIIVVEAYVPNARQRDGAWYARLVDRANDAVRPLGLGAVLLLLANDETALWLLRPIGGATAHGQGAVNVNTADLGLTDLIAAATASAGGRVVERVMPGRLIARSDSPLEPRGRGAVRRRSR